MEREPSESRLVGGLGWLAVGVVVAGWDITQDETMSSAYRRYQPWSDLAMLYVVGHLTGLLPERVDFLKSLGRFASS